MKSLLFLPMTVWLSCYAYSQDPFAEIDLRYTKIGHVQAFPLYDSLFLSYSEFEAERAFWINASGKQTEVGLPVPRNSPIAGIVQQRGTTYYYYFSDLDGYLILKVAEQATGKPEIIIGRQIFPVPGELLGVHIEENNRITLVSYLKKENRVRILSIDELKVVSVRSYEIPFDLGRFARHSSGFMVEKQTASIEKGSKVLKLYHEGNSVIMTVDKNQISEEGDETSVIKLDVATGGQQHYKIRSPDKEKFVSFYENDTLYQLITSYTQLQCKVYALASGNVVYEKTIQKQENPDKVKTFLRSSMGHEVAYGNINKVMTMDHRPSILVQSTSDGSGKRLVLGTVRYLHAGSVILTSNLLLTLAQSLLSYGLAPTNSLLLYTTLTGSPSTDFNLEPFESRASSSLQQVIDEYEISRQTGEKEWRPVYKGYVEMSGGAIGIYQLKGKKMVFVRYVK